MATTTLDYLIPELRLKIGDIDSTAYRYLDEWLVLSLTLGFKKAQRYFNYKYLINDSDEVYRNEVSPKFIFPEPPVIEPADEYIFVLFGSLLILEQSLESNAWNAVSFRDAEISYSNLESFRTKNESLRRLIDEIKELMGSPNKRLAQALKGSFVLINSYTLDAP